MALRILEVAIPTSCVETIVGRLGGEQFPQVVETWTHPLSDTRSVVKVLLDAESTEAVTDALSQACADFEGFRMVLLPVEATMPRVEVPEPPNGQTNAVVEEAPQQIGRVSREELYADLSDSARLTGTFLILTILSALVAVIGLTRDSVAIIIGAMVIAPFLGPNVALSLASALADTGLAWRSLRALFGGLLISLAIATVAGAILQPAASVSEIAARTDVAWGDIALAIASGAAGGLAYTTAVPTALVGVMVAVALLPPWVTFGMLLGSGQWGPAVGALVLTVLNIICLNLAGVLTFVLQGISPAARWEARRAKRISTITLAVWIVLLAGVIGVLFTAKPH